MLLLREIITALLLIVFVAGLPSPAKAQSKDAQSTPIVIELKGEAHVTGSIVRLGDLVASLNVAESVRQSWLSVELFPTPARATRVPSRVIVERLALRGIDPYTMRIAGAPSVLINPNATASTTASTNDESRSSSVQTSFAAQSQTQQGLREYNPEQFDHSDTNQLVQRAEQRVRELVERQLNDRIQTQVEWDITVHISEEDASDVANNFASLSLLNFGHPIIGSHSSKLRVTEGTTWKLVPVQIEVKSSTMITVCRFPIESGEIINASMLDLVPFEGNVRYNDLVFRIEDVVGREATRSIQPGSFLRSSQLRKPILVNRDQVAPLRIFFGQSVVERPVTCKQDGAAGDAIKAESLDRKAKFVAIVMEDGTLRHTGGISPAASVSRSPNAAGNRR